MKCGESRPPKNKRERYGLNELNFAPHSLKTNQPLAITESDRNNYYSKILLKDQLILLRLENSQDYRNYRN